MMKKIWRKRNQMKGKSCLPSLALGYNLMKSVVFLTFVS